MKAKCPICASWLVKKSTHDYWNWNKIYSHLVCTYCKNLTNYNSFIVYLQENSEDSYIELHISFLYKGYRCYGHINLKENNNYKILFSVESDTYPKVTTYTKNYLFNDLCDKNIDILDYNEVYWLFLKEAKRWSKLQVFS